jgi:hypothetical protein
LLWENGSAEEFLHQSKGEIGLPHADHGVLDALDIAKGIAELRLIIDQAVYTATKQEIGGGIEGESGAIN